MGSILQKKKVRKERVEEKERGKERKEGSYLSSAPVWRCFIFLSTKFKWISPPRTVFSTFFFITIIFFLERKDDEALI